MDKIGWFLLGGGVVYLLCNGKGGIGADVGFSVGAGSSGIGGDARAGVRSFRGAQRPQAYDPLGTVGGFPNPDYGNGAYIGFGGGGALGAGVSYADQYPAMSNGSFTQLGTDTRSEGINDACGGSCYTGGGRA